jgi:hypothetical protein
MPTVDRDYSSTPLWRKLGIREGARVLVKGSAEGFDETLRAVAQPPPGVTFLTRAARDLDVVVWFCSRRAELRTFPKVAAGLARDGRLWVAWPKKASGLPTDLDFVGVQRTGLDAGLVDNKSASITHDLQGLQFVRRLEDRR